MVPILDSFPQLVALIVALGLSALFLLRLCSNPLKAAKHLSHLPGPIPMAVMGNTTSFDPDNPGITMLNWGKQYGDVYLLFVLSHPVVMVCDAQIARQLLDMREKYQRDDFVFRHDQKYLGKSVLTTDGAFWKERRAMLNPAFHVQSIKALFPTIVERSIKCGEVLNSYIAKGKPMDFDKASTALTLDIISGFIFQRHFRSLEEFQSQPTGTRLMDFFAALGAQNQTEFLLSWFNCLNPLNMIFRYKTSPPFYATLSSFIHQRRSQLEKGEVPEKGILDILVDPANGLTHQQICDELTGFMFAGHDTTAHTISFALAELIRNPKVLEAATNEVDQILKASDSQGWFAFDDVKQSHDLKYVAAVVKETLRMHPAAIMHPGTILEDRTLGGHHVPAGTAVWISTWAIHHNEKHWNEPSSFIPTRFLADDNSVDHVATSLSGPASQQQSTSNGAYLPFYGGGHTCIGMNLAMLEAKAILAFIIRNFTFKFAPGYTFTPQVGITLAPKGGLPVLFERRH